MQEDPKQKQSGFNWLGIVVFLVVVVGPTLWRMVRPIFSGASFSLPAGLPPLPVLIMGMIVLAVIANVAIRGVRRAQRGSEARLPTALPTPMRLPTAPPTIATPRSPRSNAPMPPFGGEFGPFFPSFPASADLTPPVSNSAQQLPNPPTFEPIISGKALLAATGLFGVFGVAYFLVAAVLP